MEPNGAESTAGQTVPEAVEPSRSFRRDAHPHDGSIKTAMGYWRNRISVTHGQFRSVILQNRVQKTIGTYSTARQAAVAYDWKAISLQGWGALTNFPIKSYQMEYVRNGGISPLDRTVLPPLPNLSNTTPPGIQQSLMLQMQNQMYPGGMPPDALQQVLHQSPDPMASPEYQEHIRQLCTILSIPSEHLVANVKSQVPEKKATQESVAPVQRTLVSQVADNQWRASITVDLGVFTSKEKAEIACKRSHLVADGFGSVTDPSNILEHFEAIKSRRNEKVNSINEKDGSYYAKLRIKQRAFELGPYATFEEAAVAHDKYKLVIDGMVADTFNSLVHILLSEDDATMLLEALNVKPTTISKQQQVPVQTPAAGMAYTHPTLLRVGSMSNIVAPLPVSGVSIPRVGSQTSLQEGAIELQKQLEEIESSIEGIHGHKRTKIGGQGTPEPQQHTDSATPSIRTDSQNHASMAAGQLSNPPIAVDNKGGSFPLPAYPKKSNNNAQD
eukprot:jgi/Picre1/27616/NNA_000580.t1